jgi:hypothetical protein
VIALVVVLLLVAATIVVALTGSTAEDAPPRPEA